MQYIQYLFSYNTGFSFIKIDTLAILINNFQIKVAYITNF